MEETVGKLWHRLITRTAGAGYQKAAVSLKEVERSAGIFFRALGGDSGLRVAAVPIESHHTRRSLAARIAGVGTQAALTRMDENTLRLPPQIDLFPERELNHDLYLWLAALAAAAHARLLEEPSLPLLGQDIFWQDMLRNQQATVQVLENWPGLKPRYQRLVEAYVQRRPQARMPDDEIKREQAILKALLQPGSVHCLPKVAADAPVPTPVPLWLSYAVTLSGFTRQQNPNPENTSDQTMRSQQQEQTRHAHRAERVELPQQKNGLMMMFRVETLLAVTEFLKINRPVDEDPDTDADAAARDLDHLSLADDQQRIASRVHFDLDLPSAAEDDITLDGELRLPEWDYRKQLLKPDYVCVTDMASRRSTPAALPSSLWRTARRLHHQFAALQPGRHWQKARPEGSELDMDAVVRAQTDRACGRHPSEQLYASLERRERDLACMVLADLSLSTDAWVSSEARVIDVIRDALLLFGEALGATGDHFAMAGFSSLKRNCVRFLQLKTFEEVFDDQIRGRILSIKPGYYTRLGAAIRRAAQLLECQAASQRILLILSDGKPNDLDIYDGRYGIEDSRAAILETRRRGMMPFCVTIDREGADYLPHLFGPAGFAVIRKPEELPVRLPLFYAQLTR